MNYFEGPEIRLGDKLTVGCIGFGGSKAVVVCDLDRREFEPEYAEENWGFLTQGVLVNADDFGLIHYAEATYELLFVARAECA